MSQVLCTDNYTPTLLFIANWEILIVVSVTETCGHEEEHDRSCVVLSNLTYFFGHTW